MRRALIAFALTAAACSSPAVDLDAQSPATFHVEPGGYEEAQVTRVVDGDTIEVLITARTEGPGAGLAREGEQYDVRLVGIDTPESVKPDSPVECFGLEASAATSSLLEDQTVRLVDDVENVDSYDRLLRYVYLGDEMVNGRLVANGYASAYAYPPNVRHSELFVRLEREARTQGRGLWAERTCAGDP